jgi:hypothetical protein
MSLCRNIILFVGIFWLSVGFLNAQCKGFTKRHCLPQLAPYVHNGQINSGVLYQGDITSAFVTFNAETEYRLFICAQGNIADSLYYEVIDLEGNMIYSNKEDRMEYFDFYSENTQELEVRIYVGNPGIPGNRQIDMHGCVSVIVGFKKD